MTDGQSGDRKKPAKGALPGPRGESVPVSCALAVEAASSAIPVEALDRLCEAFQRSARRWEMIIYPSIIALITMMAGAFFFIYTITRDMRELALQMEPQVGLSIDRVAKSVSQLSTSLEQMSRNMNLMRGRMETMTGDMNTMTVAMNAMTGQLGYMHNLETMTAEIAQMNGQMAQMNAAMYAMNAQMGGMRWNMQGMNHSAQSFSKPMSMFNSFMPW